MLFYFFKKKLILFNILSYELKSLLQPHQNIGQMRYIAHSTKIHRNVLLNHGQVMKRNCNDKGNSGNYSHCNNNRNRFSKNLIYK